MKFSYFALLLPAALPLAHGKGMWASTVADFKNVIKLAYPLGNGRLGVMPFNTVGNEKLVLNIDSLWSGGPFAASTYNGGNPASSISSNLASIRDTIFKNGNGSISKLLGSGANYGSYQVYGNLSVLIDGITSGTNYNRSIDFKTGIHNTVYKGNDGNIYTSTVYCSYPDSVCVYNLSSSAALPKITIALENQLANPSLVTTSCGSGFVRLTGVTQAGPPTGMKYDGIARISANTGTTTCSGSDLVIPSSLKIHTFSLVFGANTNYDQTAGTSAKSFSFKGADPSAYVVSVTTAAAAKSESDLRHAHLTDYQALAGAFELDLPDTAKSAGLETSTIISRYVYTGNGDPYLESTLVELGRHLFISSTRDNSLPPNLQGRWSQGLTVSWGADYHSNINFQMNHWGADQTGLGALQAATWNYMQNTWVPRGTLTAQLLYAGQGWVTHDEMNIFGHTAMKNSAQWADYPASAAWMMQHVFDNFDYSQDKTWLQNQGYPLLKGVAQFWLSQLQADKFTNDGTTVVNPCNSPEHGPTTFACTHYQQLIHQLFENILSVASSLPTPDTTFMTSLTNALKTLDKGLHIGTWGEVKEWKLPDSYGFDFENDTHRHLSNLVGWYPGYSLSSFQDGYTDAKIQKAVATTLYSRGLGNGLDANAGWEKVWRSACWARLNNTSQAYLELKYAINSNFISNGLSMYGGLKPPFQIDANFGLLGAVLSMLVVDLPVGTGSRKSVVLGPAIPAAWGPGQVKGLRLRGGGSVDFQWDASGTVTTAHLNGRTGAVTVVNKSGKVLASV